MICETYSGGTYIGNSTTSFTAKVVNSNPTFASSNVSYQDTNSSVVAITQNNQHIVRNQSNLSAAFTTATARNSASISKYEITFNGATQTKTSASTINYGTINSGSNLTLTVKAIDSRGNSTSISKIVTVLDWQLPTATITANRENNYEDETHLKVNATISSVNSKNALKSIKYRYKKTSDSSYSNYIEIQNNTEYTLTIDKLFAWDFEVVVTDKFGNTNYSFVIAKGTPIMFFDNEKLSVGVNCFPAKDESFEINGKTIFDLIYPVGAIYLSVNSTNPGNLFGGTWVAWGQGRVPVGMNTSGTFNTIEKTGGSETHTLTTSQMPAHDGHVPNASYAWGNAGENTYIMGTGSVWQYGTNRPWVIRAGNEVCLRSNSAGGGSSHNNLQPYITCYMWKRTA